MTRNPTAILSLATTLALLFIPSVASAHKDDYIDETLVFLTLQRGELEPEYWFDSVRTSDGDHFLRHNLALEYGVSDHLMVDGRITLGDSSGNGFDAARAEVRYRFGNEGDRPVDIALSGEVNSERTPEGDRETALEPRLILSKDFLTGRANATLNLSEEIPTTGGGSSFRPAFGLRYDPSELFRIGAELQYDRQLRETSVVPQIAMTLPHDANLRFGYSKAIHHGGADFVRIALELEF
ncbi:MAG: hypothetical protein WBX15_15775 [Thermoanaerobaculia bacterium]